MKDGTQSEQTARQLRVQNIRDAEREAVQRVFRKYGSDLTAFYQDVKRELALQKCEQRNLKK